LVTASRRQATHILPVATAASRIKRVRLQPLSAGVVAEPRLQPTVKFKPVDAPSLPELRELNERNYARLEAKLDRLFDELTASIDAKLGELGATARGSLSAQLRWGFVGMASSLNQFEKRMTKRFFWYFMTQGVASAAIILGMLKLFR